ncbi:MAG: cell cycle transcriptional regulator TrcR [Pseudomonadota bacterium]
MSDILMPKATAVWLIDNTTLSFDQIAGFCGLHHLEVKGIADGDVAENMRGIDPIAGGILTRDEIRKGEADPDYRLKVQKSSVDDIPQPKRKGARYTPVIRRADKPNAIAWFIRFHPEVSDAQLGKLIGTTKTTINAVRDKSHWNSQNIRPVDPVTLGLCSQTELDEVIGKAAAKRRAMDAKKAEADAGPGLKSIDETAPEAPPPPASGDGELSADDVFKDFLG